LRKNLSIYLSTHLPIHLSIYLSIYPSTHPPVCLSIYISIYLWLYSPLLGPWPFCQFLNLFTQSVGLPGRRISPLQGRYLHTGQHKHRINVHRHHASCGIRTHDPSVWAGEDSSCLRQRGHCDRSTKPHIRWIPWILSSWLKRPGFETHYSLLCSAEIMNARTHTSTPHTSSYRVGLLKELTGVCYKGKKERNNVIYFYFISVLLFDINIDTEYTRHSNLLRTVSWAVQNELAWTACSGRSRVPIVVQVTWSDIQSVPGGKVNIVGGHSIGHSKKKLYMYMCLIPNGFVQPVASRYTDWAIPQSMFLL
jgi:hypothetical protein